MHHRRAIALSALCGLGWAVLAVVLMLVADIGGQTFGRVAWHLRGGIVAAPFIGIAIGLCSHLFARLHFTGRVGITIVTLYVAAFLFLLAAASTGVWSTYSPSMSTLVFNAFNTAIAGLTWTGFVLILAPIAFLNHLWIAHASNTDSTG